MYGGASPKRFGRSKADRERDGLVTVSRDNVAHAARRS